MRKADRIVMAVFVMAIIVPIVVGSWLVSTNPPPPDPEIEVTNMDAATNEAACVPWSVSHSASKAGCP